MTKRTRKIINNCSLVLLPSIVLGRRIGGSAGQRAKRDTRARLKGARGSAFVYPVSLSALLIRLFCRLGQLCLLHQVGAGVICSKQIDRSCNLLRWSD